MMNYEKYMAKCIELARKGEGKVSPNPLVGCVILDEEENIISTGYHCAYGEKHAEADALSKLTFDQAKGATLFVNLEPCSHYGKTPPCSDLIIKMGIKKLVVGMKDPNPNVEGAGIEKCENAGIEVFSGVLEDKCKRLNAPFLKDVEQKQIFVALKTATTLDGKIATKTGDSKWITSEASRNEVQKIRNRYDAIMTTSSTVLADNPSMTCRMQGGRNPVKVLLDRELKTNFDMNIFDTDETVYVAVDENISDGLLIKKENVEYIKCPLYNNKIDLNYLLNNLYGLGFKSVLAEAGGRLNGELVSQGHVDKIYQFIAPKIVADKNALNCFYGNDIEDINDSKVFGLENVSRLGDDLLLEYSKD